MGAGSTGARLRAIIAAVKRSEMATIRIKPAPVILIVGSSAAFIGRCNEAVAHGRAIAVETTLSTFSTLAAQTRACAVVMPASTFAGNEALFTAMAKEAGTRLVTFPNEAIDQPELEKLLGQAIDATPVPGSAEST
jgi:hypothetical protein